MTKLGHWLLLSSLVSAPAYAFTLINSGTSYNRYATPVADAPIWAGRTITYRINTNQSIMGGSIVPELSSAEFQSAVNSAISAWNNSCGSNVRVELAGTTNSTRTYDTANTIMWDNRTTGEGNYRANTNVLAFATPYVTSGTADDCDIVVNGEASGNFAINGNASDYDLVGILVHEIGHCLGLDHAVEPGTFTSTNSILLNAVMFAGISTGDTSKRVLGQDEIDAMECVNPSTSGYSARGGYFCTSYHGSNGGATLSGTVSGGPSSTRTCGDGLTATVHKSSSSGGGCVSNAFAAGETSSSETENLGWTFLFPLIALFFLRKKFVRFFFSILLVASFSLQPAQAALEVSYTATNAKPTLIKSASGFTTAEGTIASTTSEPTDAFDRFADLYAALSYEDDPSSTWGLYYKKGLAEKLDLSGKNSAGALLLRKNSSLSMWSLGIVRKYSLLPMRRRGWNAFLELQLAGGSATYSQDIVDSSITPHKIQGSAFVVETNAYLGLQFPLWDMLDGLIKVGYGRMHSNFFTVKSVSGSRYGSISEGDRMAIRSGQDLRLVRDGISAQLGLTFSLGSGSGGSSIPSAPSGP